MVRVHNLWIKSIAFAVGGCLFESGPSHCLTAMTRFKFFFGGWQLAWISCWTYTSHSIHFMKHFLVKWISNAQPCHTYLPWSGKFTNGPPARRLMLIYSTHIEARYRLGGGWSAFTAYHELDWLTVEVACSTQARVMMCQSPFLAFFPIWLFWVSFSSTRY
jgi:hypothetical protein